MLCKRNCGVLATLPAFSSLTLPVGAILTAASSLRLGWLEYELAPRNVSSLVPVHRTLFVRIAFRQKDLRLAQHPVVHAAAVDLLSLV